jgi:hypothetical protein
VRQRAQLGGGQLPEAAEAGDAGVLADADQRDAPGGHPQTGQPGEDLGDLELVIQVGLEPQHVLPVAVGLQRLVPLGELAYHLVALDARVAARKPALIRRSSAGGTSGTGPSCRTSRQ